MLKKIILGIVAAVLLIAVENLIAQKEAGSPETRPGQRQMQRQKARAEQLARQGEREEAGFAQRQKNN